MKQTNRYNLLADKPEGNTMDQSSPFPWSQRSEEKSGIELRDTLRNGRPQSLASINYKQACLIISVRSINFFSCILFLLFIFRERKEEQLSEDEIIWKLFLEKDLFVKIWKNYLIDDKLLLNILFPLLGQVTRVTLRYNQGCAVDESSFGYFARESV